MSRGVVDLRARVVVWQLAFSLGVSVTVSVVVPALLLLPAGLRGQASATLFVLLLLGGVLTATLGAVRLGRHRFLFRALTVGSGSVEAFEVQTLAQGPGHTTRAWVRPHLAAVALFATPVRPPQMDFTTALSVAILGGVVVAAAALPLNVVIRDAFGDTLALVSRDVMREVIAMTHKTPESRSSINRRMLAAVVTPTVFIAVGCALIANAHIRRADERAREETARLVARSCFEPPSSVTGVGGLDAALAAAAEHGFSGRVDPREDDYAMSLRVDGVAQLVVPLDLGSAKITFSGSTVPVVGPEPLLFALLATVLATVLGIALGGALSDDLYSATRGIRALGTDRVLQGRVAARRGARFRVVGALQAAIERLAARFGVFARAQQDAIAAREATTRMRGLFFASVSHDLKSPLNSILGFAELVRAEPLSTDQRESLDLITSRGEELLVLIETILDAARVEAGQLSLIVEPVDCPLLITQALSGAAILAGPQATALSANVDPNLPQLIVDRVRVERAVATLVAYATKNAERGPVHIRARANRHAAVQIDIQVPSRLHNAAQLQMMLSPDADPGTRHHRGLALGLSLARSVIELHHGSVTVTDRGARGSIFSVTLPSAASTSRSRRSSLPPSMTGPPGPVSSMPPPGRAG